MLSKTTYTDPLKTREHKNWVQQLLHYSNKTNINWIRGKSEDSKKYNSLLGEITAENFPNTWRALNIQQSGACRTLSNRDQKRTSPCHSRVNIQEVRHRVRILKTGREK